jgi:F plasmid transfer operon protein TraF
MIPMNRDSSPGCGTEVAPEASEVSVIKVVEKVRACGTAGDHENRQFYRINTMDRSRKFRFTIRRSPCAAYRLGTGTGADSYPGSTRPYAKLAAMRRYGCKAVLLVGCLAMSSRLVEAQDFEVFGTRAAGMGGAFVAVADDASAVYWNPAGLAMGSYFSLLLDYGTFKAEPDRTVRAGSKSGMGLAFAFPALGVSYYRLRMTTIAEPQDETQAVPPGNVRLQTLITHQTGATLVQSLTNSIAVGAAVKLVRGIAATEIVPDNNRDDLLDEASDLIGNASNKFDADIGVIASTGSLRAGFTVRNVAEPEFEGPGGTIRLKRQFRAGVSVRPTPGLLVAADFDLDRVPGTVGDQRNVAVGAEAHIFRRAFVRSGFRINTIDDEAGGHRPVVSAGGSYAVFGSLLIDGQGTFGSEGGDRGWGIGARVVF